MVDFAEVHQVGYVGTTFLGAAFNLNQLRQPEHRQQHGTSQVRRPAGLAARSLRVPASKTLDLGAMTSPLPVCLVRM